MEPRMKLTDIIKWLRLSIKVLFDWLHNCNNSHNNDYDYMSHTHNYGWLMKQLGDYLNVLFHLLNYKYISICKQTLASPYSLNVNIGSNMNRPPYAIYHT